MSHFQSTNHARLIKISLRIALTLALALCLVLMFATSEKAKTVYEITLDDTTYTVESESTEMDEVLDEAGVKLAASDSVDTTENAEEDTVEVSITHRQYVSVTSDGATTAILTEEGDTVADVLDRLNIEMGENDIISEDLDHKVKNGDSIVINRVTITYEKETETIPYETEHVVDPEMARGTEGVKQEGVPGKTVYTYELKSIDGGEPTSTLVKTKTTEPVTEIIARGTHVPAPSLSGLSQSRDYITNIDDVEHTITTVSGSTYSVRKEISCTATAYSSRAGSHTSTGRSAQVGVIAVDPSIIPYGTHMYIQSYDGSILYGTAVAGDCGSAIKGYRIDLFFNSESQCNAFGRREMKVLIVD